jgi:hypothetical protein
MSNIIKSLFSFKSKELSKAEILELWRKSNKNLQNAEETIFKLNDDSLLDILNTVDIRNVTQLNNLIAMLKRREGRSLFEHIILHFEFCAKVFSKLNIFDYGYIFLNKFDFLEDILRLKPDHEVMQILYNYYFTENNFMSGLIYAIEKPSNMLLNFFITLDSQNTTTLNMNGFKLEKSKIV